MDENDLVYKGPWVRSAQHRLFQTLETDYAFPRATCRSLVNLIWDFVNETFGEKIHEGQIVFHAASASEPPGKRISEIKTVPIAGHPVAERPRPLHQDVATIRPPLLSYIPG
ncbi:MAG TPA: DUF1670 domain-containing protein [Methanothrix sp.]|nr:DUF1670 domain-containing protein [Methanothrix sp.]